MFGKKLLKRLFEYLRRLWLFAIAVVATGVLACIIVLTDRNPVEATGVIAGVAFFAIAALSFVGIGLVHAILSFNRSITSAKTEKPNSIMELLWVHILAFLIFIIFAALLILGGVSVFAWEAVGQTFSSFGGNWQYFLEFLFYLIITAFTVYIVPTTCISVFRLNKQNKRHKVLSIIAGIITLLMCFILIVVEILLLIHSPSTDMPSVWATAITFLAIITLVDIGMFLLTYNTLKTAIYKQQNGE